MKTEPLDDFESQLAAVHTGGAPSALRGTVLKDVERELRAGRWDRRLVRAAVLLLVVGVGINASMAWHGDERAHADVSQHEQTANSESLVATAIVVAESTDAETARHFARQIATFTGHVLTDEEIAQINDAARRDRG